MNNHGNENLIKVLVLARELLLLADEGDAAREDVGCGILYGTLRDCAYKLRALAETEIITHKRNHAWRNLSRHGATCSCPLLGQYVGR